MTILGLALVAGMSVGFVTALRGRTPSPARRGRR